MNEITRDIVLCTYVYFEIRENRVQRHSTHNYVLLLTQPVRPEEPQTDREHQDHTLIMKYAFIILILFYYLFYRKTTLHSSFLLYWGESLLSAHGLLQFVH